MSLKIEKILAKILTSIILSVICYLVIVNFVVNVSIFQYLIIEFLLVLSHTFYRFVHRWITIQQR
jgi:uncharacterized membrane protein